MERPGAWLMITFIALCLLPISYVVGPLIALLMMIAFPVFMAGAMLAADHHHRTGNVKVEYLFGLARSCDARRYWAHLLLSYVVIVTIVSVLFFGVSDVMLFLGTLILISRSCASGFADCSSPR